MGRAKGHQQAAASAARRNVPADRFAPLLGAGRSGAGLPPADLATDEQLLAAAMLMPADGRDVFSGVAQCFSGAAFAYEPAVMRVLHAAADPIDPAAGTEYLVAGIGDGRGGHAGQNMFIVFNVSGNAIGEDDVWMRDEFASLDGAVQAFNEDASDRGIETEPLTVDAVRAQLRANSAVRANLHAAARASEVPSDPAELTAVLAALAPTPQDYPDGMLAAGAGFNYDLSSFRTLARADIPGFDDGLGVTDPLPAFIAAGRADAIGPRAGAHAYVAFHVADDEFGELQMIRHTETLDLEAAVDSLIEAAVDHGGGPIDTGALRSQLAAALDSAGR